MKYKLIDLMEGYDVIATSNRKDSIIKAAKEYWLDTDGECDLKVRYIFDGHLIDEFLYIEYEENDGTFLVEYYETIDRGEVDY